MIQGTTFYNTIGILALSLSLHASAKDYEVTLARPVKAGHKYGVIGSQRFLTTHYREPRKKNELPIVEAFTILFKGKGTVLKVDDKGKPVEERVVVIYCKRAEYFGGNATPILKPGSIILTKRLNGKTVTTVNGEELPKRDNAILSPFLGLQGSDQSDQDIFAPTVRKKPGETWEFDAKKAVGTVKGMKFPPKGVNGQASFIRVANTKGVDCMFLNFHVKMGGFKLEELDDPDWIWVRSKYSSNKTRAMPLDGTTPILTQYGSITMDIVRKSKPQDGKQRITMESTIKSDLSIRYTHAPPPAKKTPALK